MIFHFMFSLRFRQADVFATGLSLVSFTLINIAGVIFIADVVVTGD
jgi:hypothetical protein